MIGLWAPNFDTYNFDYDDGGRLTAVYYPNGINQTLAWNADGSLKQVSHKNATTILAQSVYGYDGLGRRNANQETLSGQTTLNYSYQYDPLDRLTQVDNGTATQKQSYAYDALSNRVQKQLGNPVTSTTAYKLDAANQLTEARQTNLTGTLLEAYLYDNAGQQSQKCSGGTVTRASNTACTGTAVNQYGWNSFNKLAQITGATTAGYQYDDQGRRVQKTEAATITNYLYDGQSLYGEYPNADWTAPNALYVQAGTDHPLARITGSVGSPSATVDYYHQDGLGSVLATTNTLKAVTASQRFDAYGQKLAGAGTVPQYGYTGREPDASGMIYYKARYYDPNGGRFTARDPMGYADGINRYAYVGNNPINFNDPNGLVANKVSNGWSAGSTYFSNNPGAAADIGVGFTPAGIGADIYGAATGKTLFGGQELSGWERGLGLIPGVSEFAGAVRAVNKVDNIVNAGQDVVARATNVPTIKLGSADGATAGQRFPESVKNAAKAENPTATCVFCQMEGTAAQVDHSIPRALGGNATLDNAQLACPHCNASKGAGDFPKTPPPGYVGDWPPKHW